MQLICSTQLRLTWYQMEAGMFPGVILQMCYWYRPDEMSVRLLYFCQSQVCPQHLLNLALTLPRRSRQPLRSLQWRPSLRLLTCQRRPRPLRLAMAFPVRRPRNHPLRHRRLVPAPRLPRHRKMAHRERKGLPASPPTRQRAPSF